MKRGRVPLWLIRDVPALIGIAQNFWPLMILVISSGRKAMRGRKISQSSIEHLMLLLPIAEARLHYALCLQAWRALGWNVRDVRLEVFLPITTWCDAAVRFELYRTDMMELRAAATRLTEGLRETYRIRTSVDANSVHAAQASTDATLQAAALHGVCFPQIPRSAHAEQRTPYASVEARARAHHSSRPAHAPRNPHNPKSRRLRSPASEGAFARSVAAHAPCHIRAFPNVARRIS